MSNTFTKFIDSCVGAIARKVQDEFDESKHPRDKSGRFSSKGGEGRGAGGLHHAGEDVEKYGKDLEARHKETVEKQKARRGSSELEETDFEKEAKKELGSGKKSGSNVVTTSMEFTGDEDEAKQLAKKYGFDYKLKYPKGSPYATIEITGDKDALRQYAVNEGFGSEEDAREYVPELFEEDDDEGYMGMSKEELAEEEEYENARERARREKDDDRVTGPEDWDYMNEEDDDEDSESEESESDVEDIQNSLRRNVASSVEDLLEYTKDDGYDAELVSDEFMIVRKDDKEYRAHIDRAGSSYYVDRVEEW